MAEPISIQQLKDASEDAKSLSMFTNADATTQVPRRLADPIETLQYWRDYMASLAKGKDGVDGATGADGLSAYQVAVQNGFVGTQPQWIASLKGAKGEQGVSGNDGADGASAYEIAVNNGFVGTEAEWQLYIKSDGPIQALQQFMTNPPETDVSVPDYGNIPSLQGYIQTMFGNGGLPATPFSTYADMTSSALVDGDYGIVTNDTDATKNGLYTKTGGSWLLSKYNPLQTIAVKGVNLNDIVSNGVYHCYSSTHATPENNYPFPGSGAVTIVSVEANIIRQQNLSQRGVAQRYGNTISGSLVWEPWTGIAYSFKELIDISAIKNHISVGDPNSIIVDDIAQIGGHLDSAINGGNYFIQHGGVANSTNGFPITGSGGFLTVIDNGVNAVHQLWQNHNGYAYRWGSIRNVPTVWQPWRGVSQSENKILNLNDNSDNTNNNTKRNLIVYGSSTMWYLSDEFEDLADRHNLTLKNHGVSGDVLGGAGLAQGSNVVTVTFSSGTIPADINTPVVVSNAFGDTLTKDVSVELSNGVQGTLFADATFTATNLTSDMSVPPDEAYRVFEPEWHKLGDGVYIFNIGKNNVTRIDAQDIIDRQIEMIEYIPNTADFVVGGHFTNTGSSSTVRTQIEQINAAYKAKYGLKYFDINELLFDDATWTSLGLTKTAADITAINNRHLPPSLSRNSSHLSEAMDKVLADAIEDKLIALGYIA